jgi:hypothetical protein
VEVANNFAGSSGGGVLVGPSSIELLMFSCTFAANVASASGAQLTMRSGGGLAFNDVQMQLLTSVVSQVRSSEPEGRLHVFFVAWVTSSGLRLYLFSMMHP